MVKGVFEFKVSGVDRGFKFGTMALGIAEKEEGVTADKVLARCGLFADTSPSVMTLLNLFYGAAVQYCSNKKTEVDFTKSDVSDWLDELGFDQVSKILSEGTQQYVPKNLNSLTEMGEQNLTQ